MLEVELQLRYNVNTSKGFRVSSCNIVLSISDGVTAIFIKNWPEVYDYCFIGQKKGKKSKKRL